VGWGVGGGGAEEAAAKEAGVKEKQIRSGQNQGIDDGHKKTMKINAIVPEENRDPAGEKKIVVSHNRRGEKRPVKRREGGKEPLLREYEDSLALKQKKVASSHKRQGF